MIEADIVLGQLNGEGPVLPVMAHPPANTSDLTLKDFLNQIKAHNEFHEGAEKGVKLDFKSIEVFEGSLGILDESIPKVRMEGSNMTNAIYSNDPSDELSHLDKR